MSFRSGKGKSSHPLNLVEIPSLLTSHSNGFSVPSLAHHPWKTTVKGQLEPTETSHERGLPKFPLAETCYKRAIPFTHLGGHTQTFQTSLSYKVQTLKIYLPASAISHRWRAQRGKCYHIWGMRVHCLSICLQHRGQTDSTGPPQATPSVPADDTHPPASDGWSRFSPHC